VIASTRKFNDETSFLAKFNGGHTLTVPGMLYQIQTADIQTGNLSVSMSASLSQ